MAWMLLLGASVAGGAHCACHTRHEGPYLSLQEPLSLRLFHYNGDLKLASLRLFRASPQAPCRPCLCR